MTPEALLRLDEAALPPHGRLTLDFVAGPNGAARCGLPRAGKDEMLVLLVRIVSVERQPQLVVGAGLYTCLVAPSRDA